MMQPPAMLPCFLLVARPRSPRSLRRVKESALTDLDGEASNVVHGWPTLSRRQLRGRHFFVQTVDGMFCPHPTFFARMRATTEHFSGRG